MTDSAVRHAAILLIGTDERTLRIMTWLLLEAGFELAKTATAAEAVERAPLLTPAVIVIDGAPGETREEARRTAASLRAAFPMARRVCLHTHDGAAEHWHAEAEGHLHRPFHADDLLELIRSLLTVSVGSKSSHDHH